jgi:hypothetical protein
MLVHGECLVEHNRLRAIARPSRDGDQARVRPQVARENTQQRRLPGAVLTDHRHELPGCYL